MMRPLVPASIMALAVWIKQLNTPCSCQAIVREKMHINYGELTLTSIILFRSSPV